MYNSAPLRNAAFRCVSQGLSERGDAAFRFFAVFGAAQVGLSILAHAAAQHEAATLGRPAFETQISKHLQAVLASVIGALSEAAAGGTVTDFERTTWHLHMACNYLKLAAGERGAAAADTVDSVRLQLVDRLFLLQASLLSVGQGETGDRARGLLEGLELMVAVSSLLPPGSAQQHPDEDSSEHATGS